MKMCANCNPNAKNSFRNGGGVFQICENCKQISQKNMKTDFITDIKLEIMSEFEKIPRSIHAPDYTYIPDNERCLSVPVIRKFIEKILENKEKI